MAALGTDCGMLLVQLSRMPSFTTRAAKSLGGGRVRTRGTRTGFESLADRPSALRTSTAYVAKEDRSSLCSSGGNTSVYEAAGFLRELLGGGLGMVTSPTATPHSVNSVFIARQIRVAPKLRTRCRSVVIVGIVQVSTARPPFRTARRSDGGLGKSSDGGKGGPIVAQAVKKTTIATAAKSLKEDRLIEKGQPIRSASPTTRSMGRGRVIPASCVIPLTPSLRRERLSCAGLRLRPRFAGT